MARRWISKSPRVTKIEIFPQDPVVQKIGSRQQMRVVATYADGAVRDVTAEAFIESGNTDVAVDRYSGSDHDVAPRRSSRAGAL